MLVCYCTLGGTEACNGCPQNPLPTVTPSFRSPSGWYNTPSKADTCPVCRGAGRLPETNPAPTSAESGSKLCHGCDGMGWVKV